MKEWKLHLKTNLSRKNEIDPKEIVDYCLKNEVAVLGWTLREGKFKDLSRDKQKKVVESEKNIKNDYSEYENIVNNFKIFEKKEISRVQKLAQEINAGDYIWIKTNKDEYYLGMVVKNSKYVYKSCINPKSKIYRMGINNQRTNIKWQKVEGEKVPGYVSTAFINSTALSEIKNKIEGLAEQFYKGRNISDIKIGNTQENFFKLLSPDDCEDLLYFYLYHRDGYICIPSTNKINTSPHEFEMLDPKDRNQKIYIQVKNGKKDIKVEEFKDLKGKVYLLTTFGELKYSDGKLKFKLKFDKDTNKILNLDQSFECEIFRVEPKEIYEFFKQACKENKILLSESILNWKKCLE